MAIENQISNFCTTLVAEKYKPLDDVVLVELEISDKMKSWIKSPIIIDEREVKRELVKLRKGKILDLGKSQRFISDDDVKVGVEVFFTNTDGDIMKHPEREVFYKFVEGCDLIAYIKE